MLCYLANCKRNEINWTVEVKCDDCNDEMTWIAWNAEDDYDDNDASRSIGMEWSEWTHDKRSGEKAKWEKCAVAGLAWLADLERLEWLVLCWWARQMSERITKSAVKRIRNCEKSGRRWFYGRFHSCWMRMPSDKDENDEKNVPESESKIVMRRISRRTRNGARRRNTYPLRTLPLPLFLSPQLPLRFYFIFISFHIFYCIYLLEV